MPVVCFTSFTFSYLAKARVLATSLRKLHPDWQIVAVITDQPPPNYNFEATDEPFDELIWPDELLADGWESWIFRHDVVEACTAVKGPVLDFLAASGAEKIFYLDPDIAVLGSLSPLVEALDRHSILLTPHQLEPDDRRGAILDNEVSSLRHGIYNLGFIGIRADTEGRRFARWWRDRLLSFCYDDLPNGIFVDQKWCDLAPAFFEKLLIVRDPGCNVASWNLNKRAVSIGRDGAIQCNGVPLRFFHFTKLGPVGDAMTERYARENIEVYELWAWYRRQVEAYTDPAIPPRWWYYGSFRNGIPIPKEARVLYRQRTDLQQAFPDPFGDDFLSWLRSEGAMSV